MSNNIDEITYKFFCPESDGKETFLKIPFDYKYHPYAQKTLDDPECVKMTSLLLSEMMYWMRRHGKPPKEEQDDFTSRFSDYFTKKFIGNPTEDLRIYYKEMSQMYVDKFYHL